MGLVPDRVDMTRNSSKDLPKDDPTHVSEADSVNKHEPHLLSASVRQFDRLVQEDQLFYEPSEPEHVQITGFNFEFRIVSSFLRKPILAPDDPRRDHGTKKDPFTNPERDFIVTKCHDSHLLQLNKYSVYRPQFILHPCAFAPQTDDLDLSDFTAIHDVFQRLDASEESPYVAFYNCGADAGSSQGHKHIQMIPKPNPTQHILFPDKLLIQSHLLRIDIPITPPKACNIPYSTGIIKLTPSSAAEGYHGAYTSLLEWLHNTHPNTAYDVILTTTWMCMIPRRHAGRDGVNTNAMGMMGLCWVADQEERDGWTRLGYTKHLEYMGVPASDVEAAARA